MKNYLRLKTCSFSNARYVFVDTVQLFYRKLFFDACIKPRKTREYHKRNSNIRLIECTIHRGDTKRCEEMFPEIRNKALLLGYSEYDEVCELLRTIEEGEKSE